MVSDLRIYFYPNSTRMSTFGDNPYTRNLANGLSERFTIINKESPTSLGMLDIFRNIFKTDLIVSTGLRNFPKEKQESYRPFY